MKYLRSEVVELARSWIGKNEKDGSHREIVDIYNSMKKKPRGVNMEYTLAWCACTWSALAIKLGYTEIMPVEISCYYLIELAKNMGIWEERDDYIPQPGDAILYDWQDNGKGDNTGAPDHIGVVEYVNEKSGYIVVIEGNYNDSVKKRTISINGKYIRGYIVPKYDEMQAPVDLPDGIGKTVKELALEVISGLWGNGEGRVEALKSYGYDPAEIQKMVNQILNTPKIPEPEKESIKQIETSCCAKKFNKTIAGTYTTTANVYCRNDAGTNKKALCLIPKGTKVNCYGYYNLFNSARWFLIQFVLNGVLYTGFTHENYLKNF